MPPNQTNPNIVKNQKSFSGNYKILSKIDIGQSCYNQMKHVKHSTNTDHLVGEDGNDEDEILRSMLEGSEAKEKVKSATRCLLLEVESLAYFWGWLTDP